jgi:hypothetical protein
VEERIQTFKDACAEAAISFRQDNERVVFVIPKRNIETWLAYLRGEQVDETRVYPKYESESDCKNQVTRLDEMCRRQILEPELPPPSLIAACSEFQRISR